MKKTLLYIGILLAGWSISSCKKETSIENSTAQTGATFIATINGVQWAATANARQATVIQGLINITGISSDNQEISITLTDTSLGKHVLTQQSTSLAAYADIDSSDLYAFATNQGTDTSQAGGEVTLTQIDQVNKTLSGTFSFKVYRDLDGRQKTITAGLFNKIPYTTSLPATSSVDTLQATIDANAWNGQSIEASINSGELSIVGASSSASQSIGLLIPANATPGTYPLDGSNPNYTGLYTMLSGGTASGAVATQGSITITQNNTATSRVRGTFQFTAVDPTGANTTPHTIANGVFSIYYGK